MTTLTERDRALVNAAWSLGLATHETLRLLVSPQTRANTLRRRLCLLHSNGYLTQTRHVGPGRCIWLYGAGPRALTPGEPQFQGFIGDDPVLVYDFKRHPDGRIGEAFIEDLASVCRGRLGPRCFIIAPSTAVEPYEDYMTVDGTRFFFLRIPYSIIAELHKKAFSDLRQPTSEARTNAPIDSVGFDFIQPPHVECRYTAREDAFEVEVVAFESEAFAAAPSKENIADLAMVLIDYDYDDEVFSLSAVHFAEDLERDKWRFVIPRSKAGERIMLVYVDLYGNEHREVLPAASFGAAAGRRAAGARPQAPAPRKSAAVAPRRKASAAKTAARAASVPSKKATAGRAATKKAAPQKAALNPGTAPSRPKKASSVRDGADNTKRGAGGKPTAAPVRKKATPQPSPAGGARAADKGVTSKKAAEPRDAASKRAPRNSGR